MPTLTWLTRDRDVKAAAAVPYRLLEAAPEHDGGGADDRSENLLIQGDNLHALKALLPYYAGRVKCVFIDPPYNTRQDFAHLGFNSQLQPPRSVKHAPEFFPRVVPGAPARRVLLSA